MPAPAERRRASIVAIKDWAGWLMEKQKLNTQQWALLFYNCNHCSEISAVSASRFRRGRRKGR